MTIYPKTKMKPPTIKITFIEGSKLVRLERFIPLIAAIMAAYSIIPVAPGRYESYCQTIEATWSDLELEDDKELVEIPRNHHDILVRTNRCKGLRCRQSGP
jgi:hypothetical protein